MSLIVNGRIIIDTFKNFSVSKQNEVFLEFALDIEMAVAYDKLTEGGVSVELIGPKTIKFMFNSIFCNNER